MIDWKARSIELAELIIRYKKGRLITDRHLIFNKAEELIKVAELEDMVKGKFLEMWHCEDELEKNKLYEDYLELMHQCASQPR